MTPDGAALGKYPRAFTHLGLIEAALALERAADPEVLRSWRSAGHCRPPTAGGARYDLVDEKSTIEIITGGSSG